MNKITIVLLFFSLAGFSQKEKKGNAFSDAAKLALAKQKLYAGSFASALNLYREVEKNNPDKASVKYYVGLCHFNLKQIDNSKKSLLRALEIGVDIVPETYFVLGTRIGEAGFQGYNGSRAVYLSTITCLSLDFACLLISFKNFSVLSAKFLLSFSVSLP